MAEIGLIAPNEELADLGRRAAGELNTDIEIRTGLLDDGVAIARELSARGCQVIISRGETARRIAEARLGVAVVEIRLTGYDVVRALAEARQVGERAALVVFEDMVYDAAGIGRLLGIAVQEHILSMAADIRSVVHRAVSSGCQVVIGGAAAVKFAQAEGIPAVLISSGKEAFWQAIGEAGRVAAVRRQEQEKAVQLKAMLNYAHDGILAVDGQGNLTIFNPAAEKVLGIAAGDVLGRKIQVVLPDFRLENSPYLVREETGLLMKVRQRQIVVNKIPLVVEGKTLGVVLTFQEVSKLQKMEQDIRKKLHLRGYVARYGFADIIGGSPAVQAAIHTAGEFARVDSTVLILGETGVGKEVFAQSIHNASNRASGPFVAINCSALPENLLESELFGYVPGAFTGARREGKAGLFELAHGGTIFLDEVGDMSPRLQARLLRVLEEKEVMRLGDDRVIPVEVRIIAATNKNLQRMVERGEFREDLYYRLNVLKLHLPSLRDRKEDIPLLVRHFLEKYSRKANKNVYEISARAMEALVSYNWPGNIRELENYVERLVVLTRSAVITLDDLRAVFADEEQISQRVLEETNQRQPGFPAASLSILEAETIRQALIETDHNYARAAGILGIHRTTLWRKLKKLGWR